MLKLAKPDIPDRAINKVVEVLRSGDLIQGKYVRQFEESLCSYLGVKHAVVVSSGTSALHLSLMALGIVSGDEVVVPALTFPATANVVEITGAKPVFADVCISDFCLDSRSLEKVVSSNTKAIIPVHEFGQPADIDEIMKKAKKFKLKVIEDAACALGSKYKGRFVGTFGDLGCFSFHPRKTITTGEGGAVVTDRQELAEMIRSFRNHGMKRLNNNRMDFISAGLNYRMTEFQAVLGLIQMPRLEKSIEHRIKLALTYNKHLSQVGWIKIPESFPERRMIYQTYHLLVDDNIDRDSLIEHLRNEGIESNYGAQALNCLEFYSKKYRHDKDSYHNATRSYKKGLALPMGNHINGGDVKRIAKIIKEWEVVYENRKV